MSQFSLVSLVSLVLFFWVLVLVWGPLMNQFSLFFLVLFFLVLVLVLVWGSLMSQFLCFFCFCFGLVGKTICRSDAL